MGETGKGESADRKNRGNGGSKKERKDDGRKD
jgi:hypothetical protein